MRWFRGLTFVFCKKCKRALKVAQQFDRYFKQVRGQAGKETFVASSNAKEMLFYLYNALKFRLCT